jgi:hypothetical protein
VKIELDGAAHLVISVSQKEAREAHRTVIVEPMASVAEPIEDRVEAR